MQTTEEAFKFGRYEHLAGVVARPAGVPGLHKMPAVIMVNAGFVHHVGPLRLYVELARELARLGVTTLRFDLSGLGDSGLPPGRQAVSERKNADIGDAIEFMQAQFGMTNVIMLGLCSGAVDSHRAALAHIGVEGVVMMDPPAYPDTLYYVLYYLERLSNPSKILRYLLRVLKERASDGEEVGESAPMIHKPMPAETFADQIESVTKRGVSYLCTFSRMQDYKHSKQFYSILTRATPRAQISVHHFPKFDHTQILQADRRAVIEVVCQWVHAKFLSANRCRA